MADDIQNIEDLTTYLETLDVNQHFDWFFNYILYGQTYPLFYQPNLQTRSSFVKQIFNLSKKNESKLKIKNSIINVYKNYPESHLTKESYIDLLEIIGTLDIDDLFINLWQDAFGCTYKNIYIEQHPDNVDLHTFILKALFGLSIKNEKMILEELKIIHRDISDPKYMLECFNKLYPLPGRAGLAFKYVPYLIHEMQFNERNYDICLGDFIRTLDINSLKRCIINMIKQLIKEDYYNFIKILDHEGYCLFSKNSVLYLFDMKHSRIYPFRKQKKSPMLYIIEMDLAKAYMILTIQKGESKMIGYLSSAIKKRIRV